MLRIKENVTSKELERFGYKKIEYQSPFGRIFCYIKENGYDCMYQRTVYNYITSVSSGRCYSFNSRERGYSFPNFSDYIEIDNEGEQVLFADLIQASLVEKAD